MGHQQKLEELGITVPDILLPETGVDLKKWAVVACDQYTSEPEYWKRVENFVGNAPSTLHLIYPEVYLSKGDKDERIQNINSAMERYLDGGLFRTLRNSFVYTRRTLPNGNVRKGLLLALDLERYSYEKGSVSLIRATEGTILDRLPPRIEIRKNAPVELPHIMVLIDDKEDRLFSLIEKKRSSLPACYNTELMEGGGEAAGFQVTGDALLESIAGAFEKLYRDALDREGENPLLFAMGDGNHSFATAKAIWEETKQRTGDMKHPARWALVEIVTIYDPALLFEPIHRLAAGFELSDLREHVSRLDNVTVEKSPSFEEGLAEVSGEGEHRIAVVSGGFTGILRFRKPEYSLAAASLDALLEECMPETGEVDYIHGAETARCLAEAGEKISFILPDFEKEQLFPTVIRDGALPRKTFSMGEAREKRYYLEARKITP